MELLKEPWPWYVSGPMLSLVMFLLLFFNKRLGMASNLRALCAIGGAGKISPFFKYNWRSGFWNLIVISGVIVGGVIAIQLMAGDYPVGLSEATIVDLEDKGFTAVGLHLLPEEIFSLEMALTPKRLLLLLGGGFLVGFGARYAHGCTTGHAISGLSNLQIPSFLSVIGFLVGGIVSAWLILPYLL